MAFYVDKLQLAVNAGLRAQWGEIGGLRAANDRWEKHLGEVGGLEVNAARLPADVWRDFDTQTKMLMVADEGATLLADLMPLARSVNIGKIVSEYRRLNGDLAVKSSVDGQHTKPVNHTTFDYDGAIVPVHSTQVGRIWRELEGMRSEGYDALREDQEQAVRFVNKKMATYFAIGDTTIRYKGYAGYGLKTSPNTRTLALAALPGGAVDLTSPTLTYAQAFQAFVAILQGLLGENNNAVGNVTIYLSQAIYFNLLRPVAAPNGVTESFLVHLSRMPGIAAVKMLDSTVLTGNQVLALILSSEYVRPIVGMPVTTTPINRQTPMDDFHAMIWSAAGIQIKADAQGRSGVLYAA
jgi:hypothetical protein